MLIERLKRHGYRLLKRGSRFFKIDLFYLTKGGFWLALGRGGGMASGLILSVAFANLLPKESFGTYQFILSLAGIVGTFTLTGMTTAIHHAIARGNEGALRTGFATKFKWNIGIALAAFAVATYYFVKGNDTLAVSMLIVGALAPLYESFVLGPAYLIGKKDFRAATIFGLRQRLIPFITVLVTIALTDNPILIVLAYFASQTTSAGLIYINIVKTYNLPKKEDGEMLTFSKHLSAMKILSNLSTNLDKILLFHFLGAAPVAIYSFAMMAPRQMRVMSRIVVLLATVKFISRPIGILKETVPRKALLWFVPVACVTALYIIAAPYLFKFLFPQYMESVIFSQVAALALLFSPTALYKAVFGSHQKLQEMYLLSVGTPIVRIILLLTLLPSFGIWGAIAAMLGTRMFNFSAILFLFHRMKAP